MLQHVTATSSESTAPDLFEGPNGARKVLSAAVRDVIAVDAGKDDVADSPLCDGARRGLRLRVIWWTRHARRVHRTELASSGASVACMTTIQLTHVAVNHLVAFLPAEPSIPF